MRNCAPTIVTHYESETVKGGKAVNREAREDIFVLPPNQAKTGKMLKNWHGYTERSVLVLTYEKKPQNQISQARK